MLNDAVDSYKENGWKYFTPARAWMFLRSIVRKLTGYRLQEKHAIAFSEIVTYKALTCPECVAAGQCRACKCPINELFVAMDAPCSENKFPAFQETRSWKRVFRKIWYRDWKGLKYELRKLKHWTEEWEDYKEEEGISLIKFED